MSGQRKYLKLSKETLRATELVAVQRTYTTKCNHDSNVYCSEAVMPDDDNGPGWVARRKNTRATKPAGSATC